MHSRKRSQDNAQTKRKGIKKVCQQGHTFYKSSDCPVCPQCAANQRPDEGFTAALGAPARRALESLGIRSTADLSRFSEKELLAAHGFGPSSLPVLREALAKDGLQFRQDLSDEKNKNR